MFGFGGGFGGWNAPQVTKAKVWATDHFVSEFCDDFADDLNTSPEVFESWQAFQKSLDYIASKYDDPLLFTPELVQKIKGPLESLRASTEKAEMMIRKYQSYQQWKMQYYMSKMLDDIYKIIYAMEKPGDLCLFPVLIAETHDTGVVFVAEYLDDKYIKLTIVNPNSQTNFHPKTVDEANPTKLKQMIAMTLAKVEKKKFVSEAWWSIAMLGSKVLPSEDTFYSHFLSWLTDMPHVSQIAEHASKNVFATPAKSATTVFWKSLIHSFKYILREHAGLTPAEVKYVRHFIKRFMLEECDSDLGKVKSLKFSSKKLIEAALRNTAVSISRNEKMFAQEKLEAARKRVEELQARLLTVRCDDDGATKPPPLLDITQGWDKTQQPDSYPLMECLRRLDSTDQFVGSATEQARSVPINFLRIPQRCTSFEECLLAVNESVMLITRIVGQLGLIKNQAFLIISHISHLMLEVLPVPLGPKLRKTGNRKCVWSDTPIRYGQQLHLLQRLHELCEYFLSAIFTVDAPMENDGTRLTVVGMMTAIADAVIRNPATDKPSLFTFHLNGFRDKDGYGFTLGKYAEQTGFIQFLYPEALIARQGILDYFEEVCDSIPTPNIIWKWEEGIQKQDKAAQRLFRQIAHSEAFQNQNHMLFMASHRDGEISIMSRYFTEMCFYRNITFFFKHLMHNIFVYKNDWLSQWYADLRWEYRDGEGFDVYAFEGTQMKTEAKIRHPSMSQAAFYTKPHEVLCEDDILHIKNLPTFDDVMGQRDSELLISYLTVPYIRIPLVLRFFATEDRISCLKNSTIQGLLSAVLFEAGTFLTIKYSSRCPQEVPSEKAELLACPYGLLLNELMCSTHGVIDPLVKLIHLASELDAGTVYNEMTTNVILFLIRTVARVENYVLLALDIQEKRVSVENFRDVNFNETTRMNLRQAYQTLRGLIANNLFPMLDTWVNEAMSRAVEAQKTDDIDKATALAAKLHTHEILLVRNVRPEDYDVKSLSLLLAGFTFLTTRYTWNTNVLPEIELYNIIHRHRRHIIKFLSSSSVETISRVLDSVVRITTSSGKSTGPATHQWGFVAGNDCVGRFARLDDELLKRQGIDKGQNELMETLKKCLGITSLPSGAVTVHEGMQEVELNIHTLSLTFKNAHLRALPSEIAQDGNVFNVFAPTVGGKQKMLETMQCAIVEDAQNRLWVRLVGQDHDIQYWKTPDPRFPIPNDNALRFYPDDLAETEAWVEALFEPIRLAYFERSFWDPPIFMLLQDHKLTSDNCVATLTAVDSQSGRKLKEVYVFRDFRCVHVYDIFSHGRRYYRRLVYTSNVHYSLLSLQPSVDRRAKPWPIWGRHAAGDPDPDQHTESSTSAVIIRHANHPDNISRSTEMFVPNYCLYGLIPSCLLDTHRFWQDPDDNIRGYPVEDKDDTNKPTHILWLHWRETFSDPLGMKNTCIQVHRFARAKAAPKASEEAILRSQQVKIIDQTDEELEMIRAQSGMEAANAELEAGAFRQSSTSYTPKADAATIEDYNLLLVDLMYAREGTPLYSLGMVLTRIETLSHILVWTTKTDYDANRGGPLTLDVIQLPRLKLSFCAKLAPDGHTYLLYSMDHAHLYVSNIRQPLVTELLQGVPHSVIMQDSNAAMSILVPSLNVHRPYITTAPFTTELVINRADQVWYRKLDTRYYLYPIHVSLSFMFTPTLASALYMLLLRFFHRNYTEVFRLSGSIGTDMDFTPEEQQIFNKLVFCADSHANAFACRSKISLMVADSPITLGWYSPDECANMIAKSNQVTVACRLASSEERRLLYICHMLEAKMTIIRDFCVAPQNSEGTALIMQRLSDKASMTEGNMQQRRVIRLFYQNLTTQLREKLDVRIVREDLNRLLLMYNQFCRKPMPAYLKCLLFNRRSIVEAEHKAEETGVSPQEAEFHIPALGKDLKWLFYTNYNPMSAQPPGSVMKPKNDEGRIMSMSKNWDYWYCGASVRKANQCRCRGCPEHCGPNTGCPCLSCEKYNQTEGKNICELQAMLDFQKSTRQLSFFEAFMWVNEALARYSGAKYNPEYPYLEKQTPSSLREPMNAFLRFYELATGTTKVKISSSESGKDFGQILFHFLREARNESAGLGHMMHFVNQNPQVWSKLTKFNRTSKQKIEQRVIAIYNSIWTLDAQYPNARDEIDKRIAALPQYQFSEVIKRNVVPRPSSRSVDIPLYMTTILPIPRNTDCNKRTLNIPDFKQLVLLGNESGHLQVTDALLKRLAEQPLQDLIEKGLLTSMTREQQNLSVISKELPFNLNSHPDAVKTVARDMLKRLDTDMADFANQENTESFPKLVGLATNEEVREVICGKTTPKLKELRQRLNHLCSELERIREEDSNFLAYAMPVITRTANHIEFGADRSSSLLFLRRFAGKEATLTIDYLISSLCSSTGDHEWQQLNPFLKNSACEALFNLIAITVLRANRVGHANRVCETVKELLLLLSKADNFPQLEPQALNNMMEACVSSTIQKSDSVAQQISTGRVFVDKDMNYDPRFLLFEFTWNLVLRPRQRHLILDMYDSILNNKSIVKQMIMGAGKTTVVGPLLALMLADSKNLVIQVVPPALLDFTRAVLRTTFSSVLQKQIFTFMCDRGTEVDSEILSKFQHARQSRGIVVTTPSSLKSIFLKYIEGLDRVTDDHRQRSVEMEKENVDLLHVLKMWREGILIMDEVDLLLHPLKSELNFPIGVKNDIDFTPTRWKLPIHLIDAIFYYHTRRVTTAMKESPDAMDILHKFRDVVREGLNSNALQEMPHLTLLNMEFYDARLKPVLAEWLLLFLKAQHLTGLNDTDTISYMLKRPTSNVNQAEKTLLKQVSSLESDHVKMLNLAYDWLNCYMPHVMQKIDRVSFGIMNNEDMRRAREEHPNMPRSRFVTSIPFIGKDLPSQSSEFAHPDVVIGLTILAYRYEGLRTLDFTDIMREIHASVEKEVGRFSQRRTNILYQKWVQASGGKILSSYNYSAKKKNVQDEMGMQPSESVVFDEEGNPLSDKVISVLPLKLMKQANQQESDKLFKLFRRTAEVIHWYLCETIFPEYMRHQQLKLSASGQELGGNIMFERRIGFSGTPSDLLPIEFGRCDYERGTDGNLIHTLTNPMVMSFTVFESGWSVRSLLDWIANASPPFHALIDTGALITGMSNLQVAQYLLKHGLSQMEGVVFLDEFDRKMILVRATGRVLKLAECGIPKVKRFAFYDQVHTTGMDIEHTPNAMAVQTLGKDMTFRDFSQGAYRMRGIAQGQTVHLLIIPEVYDLINRTLRSVRTGPVPTLESRPVAAILKDVTAWLLVNSIKSEHTQHNQLCLQSCANVWRKEAFHKLVDKVAEFKVEKKPSAEANEALQVFREPVTFEISSKVPVVRLFSEGVAQFVKANQALINTPEGKSVVSAIMDQTKREDEIENPVIDVQMVQEQEEEKEITEEQEKEQEIEIEKFVDLAYTRDEEHPSYWKLETLKDSIGSAQFYKLSEFHLYKRRAMDFPDSVMLSRNYFNPKWAGHRRIKNIVVTMEWIPCLSALKVKDRPSQDYGSVSSEVGLEMLSRTLKIVEEHQKGVTVGLIQDLLTTALHFADANSDEMQNVCKELLKKTGGKVDSKVFYDAICGNFLRQEEAGRYTVGLTLAEAETIRRVIHLRLHQPFLPGHNVAVALNVVPSNNAVLDVSTGFQYALPYLPMRNYQCLRYFDCDLHYTTAEFGVLLRSLHANPEKHRQAFFQQVIATRRRARQRWERTPIALLFSMPNAFTLLHQRTIGLLMKRYLESIELNLGDAYIAFNNSHSGILSPDEVWGAMKFCHLNLNVGEVLDFIEVSDTHHEGTIQYPDFLAMLTGSRELEETQDEEQPEAPGDQQGKKLPTVEPHGAEELKAAKNERVKRQTAMEAEANKELESENQRVMDEIEAEQIAEDIASVQEVGNPFLDDYSLTFSFSHPSVPKLVAPYGARVRRLAADDNGMRAIEMHSNSGLKFSLRLLKRLAQSKALTKYALSFEFRIPKPRQGDTKKSILTHLARMGHKLQLVQWALPMYRFSGYTNTGAPQFEVEVFGAASLAGDRSDPDTILQKLAASGKRMNAEDERRIKEKLVFEQQRKKTTASTGTGAGAKEELVHVFTEPRPAKDPDDETNVGAIKVGDIILVTGEKTNNSIDGQTYEWVKISHPHQGWVVKEKNGKTFWDHLGTTVQMGEKGLFIEHGTLPSTAGTEHMGTFDEEQDEEDIAGDAAKEKEDEEDHAVELAADVNDLLEAIRKGKRLKPGDKVTRNPECWEKGNEDGGAGTVGKVLKIDGEKAHVQWPTGNKGQYMWGRGGRFELIKVGEAEEGDEGEERETMNDERWLGELRKGGQKCNNCSATKLEPGNWFRCNHCENYHLCKKCFRQSVHSEHDFTDMGALSQSKSNEIAPGAFVRIKLSVTNPKYGWDGQKAGAVGIVLDVDHEDNCVTIEMVDDGLEWRGDMTEIEVVDAPREEDEGEQKQQLPFAFLASMDPVPPTLPFMTSLIEMAKEAREGRFKVGDKVKVRYSSSWYPGDVKAVVGNKIYAIQIESRGVQQIHERELKPCPFKIGDRVKYKRGKDNYTYGCPLNPKEKERTFGTVTKLTNAGNGLCLKVQFENYGTMSCLDNDMDVVGNGKWTFTKTEGGKTEVIPLPTGSNVMTERSFTDGTPTVQVFIKDDMYTIDFMTNEVKRGNNIVGKVTRDPPEAFVKGEEVTKLDDTMLHVVTMFVNEADVTMLVDGTPMSYTTVGALQSIKDESKRKEMLAASFRLIPNTPMCALASQASADMAKTSIGSMGKTFPARLINWIRLDWYKDLCLEELQAWHQVIDVEGAWTCMDCNAKNCRRLDACASCKAPRIRKKTKQDQNTSKFKVAYPKSKEAQAARQKLQSKLRGLYQRELDNLDEIAEKDGKKATTTQNIGPNLPGAS